MTMSIRMPPTKTNLAKSANMVPRSPTQNVAHRAPECFSITLNSKRPPSR
jgi:hypothetical protein